MALWLRPGLTKKISKEETDRTASDKIEEPRTLLGGGSTPREATSKTTAMRPSLLRPKSGSTLILGSDGWRPMLKPKANPEADSELDAALKLFKQGNLDEAETAFTKIAKKRKGTHWGEKSQYYLAEIQYQQKKYVECPRQLRAALRRLPRHRIPRQAGHPRVLHRPDVARPERPQGAKPEQKLPWTTHFTGEQPIIDTQGTGLKALEHVRHHDPTGATGRRRRAPDRRYHMNSKDYESAAHLLRSAHHRSPQEPVPPEGPARGDRRPDKGYLGPEYDGVGPGKGPRTGQADDGHVPRPAGQYEKLYHTLDLINDQEAERAFMVGDVLQARRQGRLGRVLLRQDPPAVAQQPLGRQGQDRAGPARQDAAEALDAQQDHDPAGLAPTRTAAAGPMGGMGGMGGGMGGMGGMAWAAWVAWAE